MLLKLILISMKTLYETFVIPPENGDNRFLFQPIFRNKSITRIVNGKLRCFLQEDLGYNRKNTLSVKQCYDNHRFLTHDELLKLGHMPEGAYLLLRKTITEIFSKR